MVNEREMKVFLVEMDVDEYGYLHSNEGDLPPDLWKYLWSRPHPKIGQTLAAEFDPGAARIPADFMAHNHLRDFACTAAALTFLRELPGPPPYEYATLSLGSAVATVTQIATAAGLTLDREQSSTIGVVVTKPFFRGTFARELADSIFRVNFSAASLKLFCGSGFVDSYFDSGLTSLKFTALESDLVESS